MYVILITNFQSGSSSMIYEHLVQSFSAYVVEIFLASMRMFAAKHDVLAGVNNRSWSGRQSILPYHFLYVYKL